MLIWCVLQYLGSYYIKDHVLQRHDGDKGFITVRIKNESYRVEILKKVGNIYAVRFSNKDLWMGPKIQNKMAQLLESDGSWTKIESRK